LVDSRLSAADTDTMANQAGDEFKEFGRKVEEKFNQAKPRVEEEVKKVIAYLNDEVVPEVRVNSSRALKIASEKLARLAEHLDRNAGGR
jgi:16S rRNA A1518/A1519 N6-dimethyltransferase RsmA/KsgA/DIM1 with predicted DNA glycosylase/AP lyase activity